MKGVANKRGFLLVCDRPVNYYLLISNFQFIMKRRFLLPILLLCMSFALQAQDFSKLHATGNAFGGWDSENPKEFTLVAPGVFKWSGYLQSGDFKFLLTKGTWDNCLIATVMDDIVMIGQTHSLRYEERQQDDFKFLITSPGEYAITVDVNDMTMIVTERNLIELPYDMWMVGSSVPGGSVKLDVDYDVEGKFYYKGGLKEGSFVIANKSRLEDATLFVVPETQHASPLGGSQWKVTSGAPETEWKLEEPVLYYSMTIDAGLQFLHGEEFYSNIEVYMVGGATDIGWDPYQAIPLEQNFDRPAEYVFEGGLHINDDGRDEPASFKFLLQMEWGPRSFHPLTANELIHESTRFRLNGPDNKWTVAEDKQGNYRITLNVFYETLLVEYLDGESSLSSLLLMDGLKVYPQDKEVVVELEGNLVFRSVALFDMTGKCVGEQSNATGRFSLGTNLMKGIYILKAIGDSGTHTTKVFVN